MSSHDCPLTDRRGPQALCEPTVVARDENVTRNDLEFLEEQINEYNFATTGIRGARLLVALLRDPNGRTYAGLSGHTWGSVAEVRFLWVDEPWQGTGIGTLLLRTAEDTARSRGCTKIVLSTHSFQAPTFYPQAWLYRRRRVLRLSAWAPLDLPRENSSGTVRSTQ